MTVAEQVISVFCGVKGYLDDIDLKDVATYEVTPNYTYTNAADTDVLAYFNADSSSTGTAVVTITYA